MIPIVFASSAIVSQKQGGEKKLPGEDSNLDKQDQNLLCYHYTTG